MAKWEYRRVKVNPGKIKDSDDIINDMGENGWELISVVPVVQAGSATNIHMYFKRPIETENDGE